MLSVHNLHLLTTVSVIVAMEPVPTEAFVLVFPWYQWATVILPSQGGASVDTSLIAKYVYPKSQF